MLISHNLYAMNAQRQYNMTGLNKKKSTEKLSSGYRINRAADDAAGLCISEKMRGQIRGLNKAADNAQDGVSYVQTADGALEEVVECLHRINELSIQAANGTNSDDDRRAINREVQELKTEIDRIFRTTKFNETYIWDGADGVEKGQYTIEFAGNVQAAAYNSKTGTVPGTNTRYSDITDDSCEVMPYSSYSISATEQDGVTVSWTAYNGKSYTTETIDWDTIKTGVDGNAWSFRLGDYYKASDTELFDKNTKKPLIDRLVSLNVNSNATLDDVVQTINGTHISTSASCSVSGRFEDTSGAGKATGISVSASMNIGAAYASKHNTAVNQPHTFDAADDAYIFPTDAGGNKVQVAGGSKGNLVSFPSAATVSAARSSSEGWKFSFFMEGIGTVTAESTGVRYYANDKTPDDEGLWWRWVKYSNGNKYKDEITRYGSGTLGALMDALTGDKAASKPGILTSKNGGCADSGGWIGIEFSLKSDSPFQYGTTSSTSVGSFTLSLSVGNSDTEQTVFDRVRNALNAETVLDIYSSSAANDHFYTYSGSPKTHMISTYKPVYQGLATTYSPVNISIQAGAEADGQNKIPLKYESLNIRKIGMDDTNTLTENASLLAIDQVSAALEKVSGQRSLFGAYQNRLEHTIANLANTEENTQAAESRIRDTDMAKEMVNLSKTNILAQAGEAMMAQANQIPQGVLSLLQ